MMLAKGIALEVLAPHSYYSCGDVDLRSLETQLNHEVETFGVRRAAGVALSFRFTAFAPDFSYHAEMDCVFVRNAVRRRASPFADSL
jgi:hypothetical protein